MSNPSRKKKDDQEPAAEYVPAPPRHLDEIDLDELGNIGIPSYLEIRERIVDLAEVPDKGVIVLALRAFGLSWGNIASLCRCSVGSVREYLKRYDPDNACAVSNDVKRAITSQMMMSGAMAALMHITPEKLRMADAAELSAVAQRMALTAEKLAELNNAKEDGKKKMASALDYLEAAGEHT